MGQQHSSGMHRCFDMFYVCMLAHLEQNIFRTQQLYLVPTKGQRARDCLTRRMPKRLMLPEIH
eukprot:3370013-Amphidinium_carterae.1